jgi:class 3 adenylate cyclase/tetratricopeptide (TPR) repeat protein
MSVCATCGHGNREQAKFCEECGATLAPPARLKEQRRTVTVLFCDVVESTSLGETVDPEPYRALLARYFERMKEVLERHGGTVEKFIGDAVMAVFGVPVAHEDDALRAVRAAAEMRDALPELGLHGRIGVMTGEVVTGTEERLATGDAVNVAARLEQAARADEVLIGEPTLRLVRDAVEVETGEGLSLKGKKEPVSTYRLRAVHDGPEMRHDMRFVGREQELALLRQACERVENQRSCELVTIVGEAGVGKSRLVAEALASVESTVVRGRCPPYGDGITYWPVVGVLKQLDVLPPDESAALAIRALLGEDADPSSPEEIAWAFRKTLEHAAASGPLVVVFDDIQWGEETFRNLIEHVALLSTGAPILLLCMARPELVEGRPTWPVTLNLEPLADGEVAELIPARIAADLRTRITGAAGGNPLFVGEMLAMADESDREVLVPPTLHAVLAARLDQLEPPERSVLERASMEGEVFHRGAVKALTQDETELTPLLAALVRKNLIRPEQPLVAGEDGFRFCHLLIRDAAYDALPKAARADLHLGLATWLEQNADALVELDEVVAYHLEQTLRYRAEVGLPEAAGVAAAARVRLSNAGRRAERRQDYGAAVNLLERAAALVPAHEFDLALERDLSQAMFWTGRDEEAVRRAEALADRAAAAGNALAELSARIEVSVRRLDFQPDSAEAERLDALLEQALPQIEAAGDEVALYLAYIAVADVATVRGHFDAALEALESASAHCDRAGLDPSELLGVVAWTRFFGSTPVAELLAWLDENEEGMGRDQFFRAYRAWSLAKLGRFDQARAILEVARRQQLERGGGALYANLTAFESSGVEILAGEPEKAAEFATEGWRLHEELRQPEFMAAAAANLADVLYSLDRLDEADEWACRASELGGGNHWTNSRWRGVRARVLARREEHSEALRLAREAVALADATDALDDQGRAYANLAEVLSLGDRTDEARVAFEQALDRYSRKGNLVMAGRMRTALEPLARGY